MLQKYSLWKTLTVFFIEPTKEHYLMDISRKINLAHTSVKKNLTELVKLGLVKESINKQGTRNFPVYKADMNHYKTYKKIHNQLSVEELIEYLNDSLFPKAIVLFGSYQKGEDTENSDIDIFVQCKKTDIELKRFEKKLYRKIQLHFNQEFSFSKEVKNNIINGIVLKGFLEGY